MLSVTRIFTVPALALGLALTSPLSPLAAEGAALRTTVDAATLDEKKRTEAGLYITAAEAAEVLATRDDVLLLDVRTPEETMLVGHPAVADANIPFKLIDPGHNLDAEKGQYEMVANAGFVSGVEALLEAEEPAAVVVMCRSGGRSAAAVNTLTDAGIAVPLYSMIDGFEGDKNDAGKRTVNGWKNAGAAWTYEVTEGYLQGVE